MSIYDVVECPYCGHEHDMDTYEFDGGNELDIECESCENEFEVIREWMPSYNSYPIEYANCECCNKEVRDSETYIFESKGLCRTCHAKCYMEWLNQGN